MATNSNMAFVRIRGAEVPLLLALILGLLAHAQYVYAPCDDAYIYLVYVKSLFDGKGLTYNGETAQGFSSILWPWLIAFLHIFGLELPRAMESLSFLSAMFVIASCYSIGKRLGLSKIKAAIPCAALVLTGDFAFYAGNGLETIFFSGMVLVVASYLFNPERTKILSDRWHAPAIFFLLILVRPEGVLISAIIIGWLIYTSRAAADGIKFSLKLITALVPVIVALKITYGNWLPDTYHAKSAAGLANINQGIDYTLLFAKHYFPVILLLALAFLIRWRQIGNAAPPLLLLLFAWIFQVTIQGGDNMVGFRTYLAILPLAYLVIVFAFQDVSIRYLLTIAFVVSGYLFWTYNFETVIGSSWKVPVKAHANGWRADFIERKAAGIWLKEHFPLDSKIALSAAGVTPFFSELPTIDMLGLNNRHIALFGHRDRSLVYAHQVGDGDFVLRSAPDVIFLSGGLQSGPFVSDREIWANPIFKRDFVPCRATDSTWVWVRKVRVLEMQKAGRSIRCPS